MNLLDKLNESLSFATPFEIPRCVSLSNNVSLHIFCDSSNRAYGAALYLLNNDHLSKPILVMAKARVAPVKPVTVPKLEMTALLLAARLCI